MKTDAEVFTIIEGLANRRKQGLDIGLNPTLRGEDRRLVAVRLMELAYAIQNPQRVMTIVQEALPEVSQPLGGQLVGATT